MIYSLAGKHLGCFILLRNQEELTIFPAWKNPENADKPIPSKN